MIAPTLHTARLTLRMPVLADFGPRAEFYASDRSVWEGGPIDRRAAWRIWASEVAQWSLMGFGPFAVDHDGAYVGEVGVHQPEGYPEPELGWFVTPEAEGRGVAAEAAMAVKQWARTSFGWDRLVNYIEPGNTRSIALALRIGGQRCDLPGTEPGDVVILHDLRAL
ncbi:N-acetyltransferase [Cereibacter changlensis JA139]|uniref:N-acetyltransferase n=2 Tax=Cereibacter changlensis TaxID=402884 RepID=A0A2T4K0B2_9RHOB|nr:GNAT family N-acetyltransferase [Cereibacter changlensis]PTE23517.1 N-acetyltransferase [Cereibacter changlensis JA139]PZX58569.1 RimJ/RimL family protein N-acetyltransferase [Cereibacter changlensis]